MLSSGNITSWYLTLGSDALGRWTYQSFAGKQHRLVTVITAYQVCHKSIRKAGAYTATSQQESLLRQSGRMETPRRAFWKDLHVLLKRFWDDRHQIILVGDFNKVLGLEPSGIAFLCSKFDLIDVFQHHHGTDEVRTYAWGSNCLDYCVASRSSADAIVKCGYEPFCHRLYSNHRAFFIDFESKALFGSPLNHLPPIQARDIRASNPKDVTK